MKYHSCDSLALHLVDAEGHYRVKLDLQTAEHLVEYISGQYGTSILDFEVLLDDALDRECIEGDGRHAYKMALGHLFQKRRQLRVLEKREMNSIGFAPR